VALSFVYFLRSSGKKRVTLLYTSHCESHALHDSTCGVYPQLTTHHLQHYHPAQTIDLNYSNGLWPGLPVSNFVTPTDYIPPSSQGSLALSCSKLSKGFQKNFPLLAHPSHLSPLPHHLPLQPATELSWKKKNIYIYREWVWLGFELRALHFRSGLLTTWTTSPAWNNVLLMELQTDFKFFLLNCCHGWL
jgi:hypothetical protein